MTDIAQLEISPELDGLLHSIYQGPLEEQPWQHFLGELRGLLQGNFATLLLRPPAEGDGGVVLNSDAFFPEAFQAYNDTYFALDPFIDLPAGEAMALSEFVDRDTLRQSDYFQSYLQPLGIAYILGGDLIGEGGFTVRLRITRGSAEGDFGVAEKRLLSLCLPHLQRAIELHNTLRHTESERELFADAIDRLDTGTVILDERAQVIRTNQTADQWIAGGHGLKIREGQLLVGDRNDQKRFRELLEEVLDAHRRSEPSFVKTLRLGGVADESGIGIVIRPLPLAETSSVNDGPAVAIFISDPRRAKQAPVEALMQLFGFTHAEAMLAVCLAKGATLDEASDELGISRNTAKSHLKAIFSKTGVSRQTKLIQLMLKSVASLAS